MTTDTFRRRLLALKETGCNVLPLDEAVRRLRDSTLPERAVAITFDDGFFDFHEVAFPIIKSFGFPVTLYLTTYYVTYNRPVFDPMCAYLLWKGRHRQQLDMPHVFSGPVILDDTGRAAAKERMREYALDQRLTGQEKDKLLAELSDRLGIDYGDLCRKRIMHLMTQEEVRELAERGLDVQYHTHRHRMYRSPERMVRELTDNCRVITSATGRQPLHFCYTGGTYLPENVECLRKFGIASATTCNIGLCAPGMDPLRLPRLVDSDAMSDLEFRAWLHGTAEFLPRRRYQMDMSQIGVEQDIPPVANRTGEQ
jgi:peptidoglycan/xylan/chitin deacetylase (PgdA/CDA1 family)